MLEVLGVAGSNRLSLAALLEPGRGIFPDRLEQAQPAALGDHEVVLDEALQRAEHVFDLLVRADALCRRDRPAAREDREPGEERPLRRLEQLVAPCDRRRQRALAV